MMGLPGNRSAKARRRFLEERFTTMPAKTASPPPAKQGCGPESGECNHHWLIDPPSGPVSTGHCKLCGCERTFPNSSEDSIWDGAEGRSRWNDMGISRRRWAAGETAQQENVVTV